PPPPPRFLPANYRFRLQSFHIDQTRSRHEDTIHVGFALKVGTTEFDPQTRFVGDVNNGDHDVGLEFGPVTVNTPQEPVVFNFQIINSVGPPSELARKIIDGAHELIKKTFGKDTFWTEIANAVFDFFVSLFSGGACDGP